MALRVAVIGAGPGGYVAAVRAAQRGAEVTLIERENVGGTCLNWGCIPSKVMITAAELLEKFHRARELGIRLEGAAHPDMERLLARKEKVIRDQAAGILSLLSHHKVRYLRGEGRIERRGLALARLEDGGMAEVPWDSLILAPGTEPFDFPDFPFDADAILSSNDALCLRQIPESIAILGGGVIGCEFAFLFSALGSQVSVIEAQDRVLPLPSVDESCSKVMQREMKKRKIKFFARRTVRSVERTPAGLRLETAPSPLPPGGAQGEPVFVEAEKLLVSVGRRPRTADLGLDRIGLGVEPGGWLAADERMETRVPGVYAVGDVLGPSRIMLAHVAYAEGTVAAENAAGGRCAMDYTVVPGAIFTSPEVANVGLSEARAAEAGFRVRADTVLFRTLGKAQVLGEIAGEAKIVSDADTGTVLGVHIVGPHATDLIAEGALAVRMRCTVNDLAETIHAHPTLSEAMAEASWKALDRSLHG